MKSRSVLVVIFLLLIPVISLPSDLSYDLITPAAASDACSGDIEPVKWNESMERTALVPHSNPYDWWYDFNFDDDRRKGKNRDNQDIDQYYVDMSLSPEADWMYDGFGNQGDFRLDTFDLNHHATILVGNDSVGALRLNLSANHRTTVCITLQNVNQVNGSDISADVYLLTSSEYDKYKESYFTYHESNLDAYGIEQTLSEIPPEWRSFNFLGWKTYRDAHQYENVDKINFALSLDGPEVYNGLFGDSEWEDFYIVIDTWDNIHDNDAPAPDAIIAADVTIITTERSLILPNFTVSLVFLVLIITLAIFPFILNARYMRAGLEVERIAPGFIPSLNTMAEIPPPGIESNGLGAVSELTKNPHSPNLEGETKDIPHLP